MVGLVYDTSWNLMQRQTWNLVKTSYLVRILGELSSKAWFSNLIERSNITYSPLFGTTLRLNGIPYPQTLNDLLVVVTSSIFGKMCCVVPPWCKKLLLITFTFRIFQISQKNLNLFQMGYGNFLVTGTTSFFFSNIGSIKTCLTTWTLEIFLSRLYLSRASWTLSKIINSRLLRSFSLGPRSFEVLIYLLQTGCCIVTRCSLCRNFEETSQYLFFDFHYANKN